MLVLFLRTRCLLCGLQLHPAEVTGHLHRVHPSDLLEQRVLMPQLLSAMSKENQTDHKCDVCTQIYNYPLHGQEDAQELTDRSVLAQIHLQHQCPVVLQIALLLQDHGLHSTALGRGLRNAGDIQADEPTLAGGQVRKTRRRQRHKEAQEGPTQERCVQRRRKQAPSGHGTVAPQGGCRATSSETTRLMDLLHANRATGAAPALVQKAAEWKQQLTVKQENTEQTFLPLRCHLTQLLAATLNQRVTRLAKCGNEDPLKKVALTRES